jgi:hypothetical protein
MGDAAWARTIARAMTVERDRLAKAKTVIVAAIESGLRSLVAARELETYLQAVIRRRAPEGVDRCIERGSLSDLLAFQ